MPTLSMSTYCLREHFGPTSFDLPDEHGEIVHIELPFQKLLDLSDVPARARAELGVNAVETVAFQFSGLDDPELERFGQAIAAGESRLVNAAIDAGDLLREDREGRAADVALISRWIDVFTSMGAQFVRVNPGAPMRASHPDTPPPSLVDALAELGDAAAARGARLLVENHGGASSDPVWLGELLRQVGSDRLGLLLDLGNFDALTGPLFAALFSGKPVEIGELLDGLDLESLYAGIEALSPFAELVHVKVHDVADDGTIRGVNLERALGLLTASGYDGAYTIEYEGQGGDPWSKVRLIADEVRRLVPTITTEVGA